MNIKTSMNSKLFGSFTLHPPQNIRFTCREDVRVNLYITASKDGVIHARCESSRRSDSSLISTVVDLIAVSVPSSLEKSLSGRAALTGSTP